MRPDRDSPEYI